MAPPTIAKRVATGIRKATLGITGVVKKQASKKMAVRPKEATLTNVRQECFITEEQENGDIHHILNEALPLQQRRNLSCRMPDVLRRHHLAGPNLPEGWKIYKDSQLHWMKIPSADSAYPNSAYLSPETIIKLGLLPTLVRMQEIALAPGFKARLDSYQAAGEKGSSHFEMGMSSSVGSGNYAVTLGRIARGGPLSKPAPAQDAEVLEFVTKSTEISTAALDHILPEETKKMVKKHSIIDASMNRGPSAGGSYISSIQLNSSPVEDTGLTSLGKFGKPHIDGGDCPLSWNVLPFLHHLPEDTFPGYFLLPAQKLACLAATFGILIFQGVFPHVSRGLGTYDVPKDSPLRYKAPPGIPRPLHDRYQRIAIPCYAKKTLTRPEYLPKDEVLSQSAIKAHWNTKERLRTWEMCFYIKRNAKLLESAKEPKASKGGKIHPKVFDTVDGKEEELKLLLPTSHEDLDPKEVVKLFPWVDEATQETRFPSVETAKVCIEGQSENDPQWEVAKEVQKACTFGFAPTDAVKAQRRKEQNSYKTRPDVVAHQKKIDGLLLKYKKYEDLGLVTPIDVNQAKRRTGQNSVNRGKLANPDQYDKMDRATQKLANLAVSLGKELNELEQDERKNKFLHPEWSYDDGVYFVDSDEE